MPWSRGEFFQITLLLLSVPVQYYLTTQWRATSDRQQTLERLIDNVKGYTKFVLDWRPWMTLWTSAVEKWSNLLDGGRAGLRFQGSHPYIDESPAYEVMRFRNKNGYFSGSSEIRAIRPADVKYRIGQVVAHRTWGYHGVIIGWDAVAKAPEEWLKTMHPTDKSHWKEMPNYAVLVDVRDRPEAQITYVPQENLKVVVNVKIKHPKLDNYFSSYDGAQYLPRPWLRVLYPAD